MAKKSTPRPKILKKYKSHDHETYEKVYKQDLDKVGAVKELAVKGAEKFWPKDKLVPIGRGRLAPKPFESNAERREFLHRLGEEKGWSFREGNGVLS